MGVCSDILFWPFFGPPPLPSRGTKRVRWASQPTFHEEGKESLPRRCVSAAGGGLLPLSYASRALGNMKGSRPVGYGDIGWGGGKGTVCDAWTSRCLHRFYTAMA